MMIVARTTPAFLNTVLRRRPDDLLDLALAVAEELSRFLRRSADKAVLLFLLFSAITSFLAPYFVSLWNGVLLAESAVLVHLKSVGIILLVLLCVVVALFAFSAS